ncbi:DUF6968 family protein [Methylobacterium persicinum]|uniref:DUF6968 domain-containing protein n=1 Tax=Methylobacterium persicinum TaxID=374426 RepID=A0ABU0HRY3_9HYPH|nr:hypothetical protein [Methylobacterium persicinum]MDQ0445080.1 hypothetical protein [Methylobacterium persicinum]GJE40704.1 hypothetical protein KHHGKMAE_4799 [Methylobacterium persicinum]
MVIAERSLTLRSGPVEQGVPIVLHAPENDDGMWICRYTIGWPEGTEERFGAGVDAFQALDLALKMIGCRLYASAHHKSGTLFFEEPGTGYGFPVPKNVRAMLIGHDKTFEG